MTLTEALRPPATSLRVVDNIRQFRERQGTFYVAQAAALAKTAFEVSGQTEDPVYRLYSGLLAQPNTTPGKLKLASIVMLSLGRVAERQTKQANPAAQAVGTIRTLLGSAGRAGPEAFRMLMTVGAATGTAAGGGIWALRRGLSGEDQKIREKEIQRDTYHQLAAEVRDELKRRRMVETPENQAAAIDYLT